MNQVAENPATSRPPGRPLPSPMRHALVAVTAAYATLLAFATHYPKPEELVGRRLPSDKLMHFVAYGVLGVLAAVTMVSHGRRSWRAAAGLVAALSAAAVVDEATQPLFRRAADPLDWVYDVIGLAIGIGAVVAIVHALRARRMSGVAHDHDQ